MPRMKGDVLPPEFVDLRDSLTGVPLRQLTAYRGHSHHFYFTNSGWWDGGRRLLLGSDRHNATDLYSLELATGELTQLTEHPPGEVVELLFSCVNPVLPEAYFVRSGRVMALDLHTLAERCVYELEPGFKLNILNCAANGEFLLTGIFEDLSSQFTVDLLHGYVGFAEYHAAKPLSHVVKIPLRTGAAETVFEERYWIGHVNTSPRHAHLATFCHEGPWQNVDHRIWGLDVETGRTWKIRPHRRGERLGHEYWLADGETVGYHGHMGGKAIYGFSRYDNTESWEAPMAVDSQHFHSNTRDLVVGDGTVSGGTPYVLLWQREGRRILPPRILCAHNGSRHIQQNHIHPRFSPDNRHVLFTSDRTGYGQVYLVEIPALETLPTLGQKGAVA